MADKEDLSLPNPAAFTLLALKGNSLQELWTFSTALNEYVDILVVNERREHKTRQEQANAPQPQENAPIELEEDQYPEEVVIIAEDFDDRDHSSSYQEELSHSQAPLTQKPGGAARRTRSRTRGTENQVKKRVKKSPPAKKNRCFDDHFDDLMAFKAKHGHCNVSGSLLKHPDEFNKLIRWCPEVRYLCKLRQRKKTKRSKKNCRKELSDEQVQRLNDAGFAWKK